MQAYKIEAGEVAQANAGQGCIILKMIQRGKTDEAILCRKDTYYNMTPAFREKRLCSSDDIMIGESKLIAAAYSKIER